MLALKTESYVSTLCLLDEKVSFCSIRSQMYVHCIVYLQLPCLKCLAQGSTMECQIPQRHVAQFKGNLHDSHIYYIEYFEVTEAKKTYQAADLPIMARFTKYTKIKEMTSVPDSFPLFAYTYSSFQVLRGRIGDQRLLSGTLIYN